MEQIRELPTEYQTEIVERPRDSLQGPPHSTGTPLDLLLCCQAWAPSLIPTRTPYYLNAPRSTGTHLTSRIDHYTGSP